MKAEVLLDIPDHIAGKLATGELERIGGVVRHRQSGKVVMWLRETSPSPIDPRSFPINSPNRLLGIIGHSASILNLGATIAFGTATLTKLSRIEEKLDVMNAKLDELQERVQQLQWTVELGFVNTLAALDSLRQSQEIELTGDLNSAANLAWTCQFLEPNSNRRIIRIEQALHTASSVKEKLLLHAQQEISSACGTIKSKRESYYGFAFDDGVIKSLLRLRQAIAASSLCASITAEADSLYAASSTLAKEHKLLHSLLLEVAATSLNPQEAIYRTLLSHPFVELMPASRVDSWARKFDQKNGGLFDVIDTYVRQADANIKPLVSQAHPLLTIVNVITAGLPNQTNATDRWSLAANDAKELSEKTGTANFINLIDGIDLDLDRLLGYQVEYKSGSDLNLSIQEYRDLLRLDSIPSQNPLVYLSLKETA